MKRHTLPIILVLIAVIFIIGSLAIVNTYIAKEDNFMSTDNEGEIYSHIEVIESFPDHLTVKFLSRDINFVPNIVMADGENYTVAIDPSPEACPYEYGKPAVPVFAYWILVPNGTYPELVVEPGEETIYEHINLLPVQPLRFSLKEPSPIPFIKDIKLYKTDANCPRIFARLGPPTIIRGQQCARLMIYPYQCNPRRKTLTQVRDIGIRVYFNGTPSPCPKRLLCESYKTFFQRIAINADAILSIVDGEEPGTQSNASLKDTFGFDYIIVTDPKFSIAADKLADWRKKCGFKTLVSKFPSTWKAEDLRNALQKAYDTWEIVPKYLFLLGDAEHIPCFYKTWHQLGDSQGYTGTDFYYANNYENMSNSTNLYLLMKDLAVGRLPVDTPEEAMRVVDRIINYEKNPVMAGSFYENATICSYFEDWVDNKKPAQKTPDGVEDEEMVQVSESLAGYISDVKYEINKIVKRIYFAEPNITPTKWSSGDPIPQYLKKPTFPWNGNKTDITSAVNAGTFLLTNIAHGGRACWWQPYYHVSDMTKLTNDPYFPVVWSITCETGWFDNETDYQKKTPLTDLTPSGSVYFAEELLRNKNGGAIGIIAASRATKGCTQIFKYLAEAIWPGYLSLSSKSQGSSGGDSDVPQGGGTWGKGEKPGKPILRMGDVLNYAMVRIILLNFSDPDKRLIVETFHWFGDPAMEIRTEKPSYLIVSFEKEWPWIQYPHDLIVKVELVNEYNEYLGPAKGAKVVISKKGVPLEDYGEYYTSTTDEEGVAIFPDLVIDKPGEYNIVATASNSIPFEDRFYTAPY